MRVPQSDSTNQVLREASRLVCRYEKGDRDQDAKTKFDTESMEHCFSEKAGWNQDALSIARDIFISKQMPFRKA
jgi:hypothetical protein